MKILVTGGAGQLARTLLAIWSGDELIAPLEAELDLANPIELKQKVVDLAPDVVINAGAFTQVDLCEAEPERALLVNGTSVGALAEVCGQLGALLVQISTDYVFDGKGTQPYREEDVPSPVSVYGRTKLVGELEAAKAPAHLIVRTAWLYEAWGNNFYRTMLRLAGEGRPLKVVDDQKGAPTSCRDLARQLKVAVDEGWRGVVHATCAGEATWYQFAAEIFRLKGLEVPLSPCTTRDFPRPAARPAYSVLCGEKRRRLGRDVMQDWTSALREVAAETTGE